MSNHFDCPLCDWRIEIPTPAPPDAVILATLARGIAADMLASLREHGAKVRLEREIEQHLSTHGPVEWLPALLEARRLVWPL